MALRSSLSGLRPQVASNLADGVVDGAEGEDETTAAPAPVPGPAPARGRVTEPAGEAAPVTPRAAGRGRPRLSDEEKAARAAQRTPRKTRAAKTVADTGTASPRELRSLIKEVETDIADVKARVEAAVDKFQPEVDRLRASHAELSAKLANTLFK